MKKSITIAIIAAVLVIIGLVYGIYRFSMPKAPETIREEGGVSEAVPDDAAAELLDQVIKESAKSDPQKRPDGWYGLLESSGPAETVPLAESIAKCPDIYAWIKVPGTDIDYPIAYCEDAVEPFYYTHDADGAPSDKGMIITDSLNSRDFSDPLTLIYGQAPDDGTMFAELTRFRDPVFFNEHDTVNIYMPDAQLTYRVYACYISSAEHIFLNSDFHDPETFGKYFDSIGDVRDLSINIRQDAKPVFTDHVITLITHCGDESKRLFVHAVLEEVRY